MAVSSSVEDLSLRQEVTKLRAELAAERERADAFADTIASQSERLFVLSNEKRSLLQRLTTIQTFAERHPWTGLGDAPELVQRAVRGPK